MTVFKGYMKILKKNIGLVIIYLVIFFSVAMALQAAASKEHLEDFEKSIELYRQSYYLFKIIEDDRNLIIIKTEAKEFLDLELD